MDVTFQTRDTIQGRHIHLPCLLWWKSGLSLQLSPGRFKNSFSDIKDGWFPEKNTPDQKIVVFFWRETGWLFFCLPLPCLQIYGRSLAQQWTLFSRARAGTGQRNMAILLYVWNMYLPGWWFQIFFFHPYLGMISNLTNIFQMGWNRQLATFGLDWWVFMYIGKYSSPMEHGGYGHGF